MSDWFATKTAAPAANGGLDLVMPGPNGPWGDALLAAVRAGEVDERTIDDHLVRLLRLADRVGALGTPRDYPDDRPAPDSPVRRSAATGRVPEKTFTSVLSPSTGVIRRHGGHIGGSRSVGARRPIAAGGQPQGAQTRPQPVAISGVSERRQRRPARPFDPSGGGLLREKPTSSADSL